jgi:hypothetical protein
VGAGIFLIKLKLARRLCIANQQKDPSNWVTGDEPMTGAQASYLKTLTEQANSSESFDAKLSKAEASKRIDALRSQAGVAKD